MLLFYLLVICIFSQTSCRKDRSTSSDNESYYDLSNKQAISDGLIEDVNNLVLGSLDDNNFNFKSYNNGSIDNGLPACANTTISGNFPNKLITINFGSGCVDTFGIFRSGIIYIQISDSIRTTGSTITVNFDNFHVKKYKKEGTIVWTNLTQNNTSMIKTWSRQVQNGKITDTTDDKYWLHSSIKNITQYEGAATPRYRYDDKYKIFNGIGSVTNIMGMTMNTTILDTLNKSFLCPHMDKGVLKIEKTGHYALLDYGNGVCDNTAIITIDGNTSNTRTIILP